MICCRQYKITQNNKKIRIGRKFDSVSHNRSKSSCKVYQSIQIQHHNTIRPFTSLWGEAGNLYCNIAQVRVSPALNSCDENAKFQAGSKYFSSCSEQGRGTEERNTANPVRLSTASACNLTTWLQNSLHASIIMTAPFSFQTAPRSRLSAH